MRIGVCRYPRWPSTSIEFRRQLPKREMLRSKAANSDKRDRLRWTSPYDGEILQVAIPTLSAGLLGPLCTAVDTAVVGRLGTRQLSGLGVGAVVFLFLSNLFLFFQFLLTPAVARSEARNEKDKLSKIIGQGIVAGSVSGTICGIVVFCLTGPIITMLAPPVQVREYAIVYLRWMATSIPPIVLYQCLAGILRGLRTPLVIVKASGLATIANIILDVLFVFGFGWGVFGAAFATSLTTYVSCGIMLHSVLTSGKVQMKDLLPRHSNISSNQAANLLGDSVALIVRTITLLALVVCSSVLIAQKGPIIHSAYEICRLVFLMGHTTYTAFEITMQALCAAYLGKDNLKSAKEVLVRSLQIVFCLTAVLSGSLLFFSSDFVRLFTSSPEVCAAFRAVAFALLLPIPIGGIAAVMDGSLIGARRIRLVAFSQCLVSSISITLLIFLHRRDLLTLLWTTVLVRTGLSGQSLWTWWITRKQYFVQRTQM